METEKIARVVTGRASAKLSQRQLEEYENAYLIEAKRLSERIAREGKLDHQDEVFKKMLRPFNFYLSDAVYVNALKKEAEMRKG